MMHQFNCDFIRLLSFSFFLFFFFHRQDATFSVSDFAEALQDYEVQRVMRAYPDTISIEIHCAIAGHWNKLPEKSYAKQCKIRINSVDILDSGSDKINAFISKFRIQ